jgi:hypothetical protein
MDGSKEGRRGGTKESASARSDSRIFLLLPLFSLCFLLDEEDEEEEEDDEEEDDEDEDEEEEERRRR